MDTLRDYADTYPDHLIIWITNKPVIIENDNVMIKPLKNIDQSTIVAIAGSIQQSIKFPDINYNTIVFNYGIVDISLFGGNRKMYYLLIKH